MSRRSTLSIAAALAAATFVVYSQTLQFGFMTIDDPIYVSANPYVQGGLTRPGLVWSFTRIHDSNWIPLTWLSLMLDTNIYGFVPAGYHLTNVLLHTANSVLLFAVFAAATGKELRSAAVAALFALHPLHVESVAWISERKDVLSGLFGLLSLLAYCRYVKTGGAWWFTGCFLSFICSLLSKQTLVTLPFVFLLLDFWPLGRLDIGSGAREQQRLQGCTKSVAREERPSADPSVRRAALRLLAEKIPFFAASAVFSAVAMAAQSSAGSVRDFKQFPFSVRTINAIVAYAAYLGKTVLPQGLAVYYPHPHENLSRTAVVLAVPLLLVISAAAIVCVRRFPFLLVGWCWYLGTLVPLIGFVQIGEQQMADRYTYIPLIGMFVAVVWLVSELVPAGALLKRATLAVLVLVGVISFHQVGLWRDNVTLLRHSMSCTPDNFRIHQFLGSALLANGALADSLVESEKAVRMRPFSPAAHWALGIGLQIAGRLDEAANQYEESLSLNEWNADVHCNLGIIQLKRQEYQAAKQNLRRSVEIDPDQTLAFINLGTLCLETGEYAESLAYSRQALALEPGSIRGRHNLAVGLIAVGRLDEAIEQFQYLAKILPNDHETHENLARALAMKRGLSGT